MRRKEKREKKGEEREEKEKGEKKGHDDEKSSETKIRSNEYHDAGYLVWWYEAARDVGTARRIRVERCERVVYEEYDGNDTSGAQIWYQPFRNGTRIWMQRVDVWKGV